MVWSKLEHPDDFRTLEWSFQDNDGTNIVNGTQMEGSVSSPLVVEALAVRAALTNARNLGWNKLCFKSNAKELIQAIKTENEIKEIYGIFKDIKYLFSMFLSFEFMFIPNLAMSVVENNHRAF